MKDKGAKTGLAGRIREVLKNRRNAISPTGIAQTLNIPPGPGRAAVWDALKDCQRRGEIEKTEKGRFRYNRAYRKPTKGRLRQIVLKAVYVSISNFSTSNIQRLSDIEDKHYIQRIFRELLVDGYIMRVGRKRCDNGKGAERVYSIRDRAKFRLELMGQ